MNIQPKYISFSDLVSKRLFGIPEYQRAYSWEREHRKALFDDIRKLTNKSQDFTHFMSTVVALKRGQRTINTDDYTRLDIVDGQQRLTTLVILLKALQKTLSSDDKTQRKLRDEIENLLVKDENGTLLLLQTNHDQSTYFANYIRTGAVPSIQAAKFKADKALVEAMNECEAFVAEWKKANPILELASLLKNKLFFVFHEINDEVLVYTVFEVLNNRGLKVSALDRAKSSLMAVAFERTTPGEKRQDAIEELHVLWKSIYRTIGLHDEFDSEVLRFAATLKREVSVSKVLGEEDALQAITILCGHSVKKTKELSQWILDIANAVDQLAGNHRQAAITKIGHARLLAIVIGLSAFTPSQKEALRQQWERVTFRIFGLAGQDARTKSGEYVRLSIDILRMEGSTRNFSNLKQRMRELGGGQFEIQEAIKRRVQLDCYTGWESELRYFFFRYEEHLARRAGQTLQNNQWNQIWADSPSKSIEHIYPQTPAVNGPWMGALGVGKGQKEADQINRLGNLALLPPSFNSEIGNKDFAFKKVKYRESGLLLLNEIVLKQKWNRQAIDEREKRLVQFATEEWADL